MKTVYGLVKSPVREGSSYVVRSSQQLESIIFGRRSSGRSHCKSVPEAHVSERMTRYQQG